MSVLNPLVIYETSASPSPSALALKLHLHAATLQQTVDIGLGVLFRQTLL